MSFRGVWEFVYKMRRIHRCFVRLSLGLGKTGFRHRRPLFENEEGDRRTPPAPRRLDAGITANNGFSLREGEELGECLLTEISKTPRDCAAGGGQKCLWLPGAGFLRILAAAYFFSICLLLIKVSIS
jgi:hypothetical protein